MAVMEDENENAVEMDAVGMAIDRRKYDDETRMISRIDGEMKKS